MSYEYDSYLERHRRNVTKAFRWMQRNLPEVIEECGAEHNIVFAHDRSKDEPDEYKAYDAYFYGRNQSYAVVQEFNRAWLLHIHRNPHHWQHWVLINDDPEEGKILLEMPYEYIIEMICDWWSFSWEKGSLFEIFVWYNEHKDYIELHPDTRKIVEDILYQMKDHLGDSTILQHHGVKGMKWGVRNGPPYPLERDTNSVGKEILNAEHASLTGPPNGITQVKRRGGGVDRNYYDANGRQIKQISNHDHGNPRRHPYGKHGEHAHDYIYDNTGKLKSRPIRELTEDERKENSDFYEN